MKRRSDVELGDEHYTNQWTCRRLGQDIKQDAIQDTRC